MRPSAHAPVAQAPRDRVITDDRSGDKLREHRDIDRDREQAAVGRDPAAMDVDQIRDRVKREERNAERQREAGQRERIRADERVDRPDGEVGVFEQSEQREIGGDTERGRELAPAALRRADRQRGAVVHHDLAGEQQDETRLAPGVEQQRSKQQNDVLRRDAWRRAIEQEEQRQEVEQECDGRKQHVSLRPSSPCRGRYARWLTAFATLVPIAAPSWRSASPLSGNSSTICARLSASSTVKPNA